MIVEIKHKINNIIHILNISLTTIICLILLVASDIKVYAFSQEIAKNSFFMPLICFILLLIVIKAYSKPLINNIIILYIFIIVSLFFLILGYNYSSYNNSSVDILTVLESLVVDMALGSFFLKNGAKCRVIAQNAAFPYEKGLYKQQTYNQMGQSYSDIILIENQENKIWFYDVKLISNVLHRLALTKGYISLVTSLKDQDKIFLFKRYLSDFKTVVNQKKTLSEVTIKKLRVYTEQLKSIIEEKAFSEEAKLVLLEDLFGKIDMDPQVNGFVCSRIFLPPQSYEYETFIKLHYKQIESQLKNKLNIEGLKELIPPKGQQANVAKWHDFMLEVIQVMPRSLKEEMLENFMRFKAIEYL